MKELMALIAEIPIGVISLGEDAVYSWLARGLIGWLLTTVPSLQQLMDSCNAAASAAQQGSNYCMMQVASQGGKLLKELVYAAGVQDIVLSAVNVASYVPSVVRRDAAAWVTSYSKLSQLDVGAIGAADIAALDRLTLLGPAVVMSAAGWLANEAGFGQVYETAVAVYTGAGLDPTTASDFWNKVKYATEAGSADEAVYAGILAYTGYGAIGSAIGFAKDLLPESEQAAIVGAIEGAGDAFASLFS